MNKVVEGITRRARQAGKSIVLPEAGDPRVLRAAEQIMREKYARVTLLGEEQAIRRQAGEIGANLADVQIVDPMTDSRRSAYVDALHKKRQSKGLTREGADKLLRQAVYYGGQMVGDGRVDGMVCGSICPTADTVRGAIFGPGTAPGCKTVSACSLMNTIIPEVGVDGTLVFADTGVVPEPTVEQLADIAIAAAGVCKALLDVEPFVAMLSFSTKGSARSEATERVIAATQIVQSRRPDLKVDGELQLDAAIMPDIARRKAPTSPVAGKANVLIFPDLSCGNIAYKLVERLGKATALGPLLMGLAKPINDLSRGCSVEDIVLITAITANQAI